MLACVFSQVTTKLTADELRAVLPSNILLPRVFLLKENTVMFLSGLARIDCLQVNNSLTLKVPIAIKVVCFSRLLK